MAVYPSCIIGRLGAMALLVSSAATVQAADDAARARCTADNNAAFYSESTGTCIKFGAYLWAEGYFNTYAKYPGKNDRWYGIGTLGVKMNTETTTAYGPLRTFVNLRFRYRTADEWSDGPYKFSLVPWDAYVDYAGFTLGHRGSLFDFYANANVIGTDPATIGDSQQLLLAAYTYKFAHGWSVALSVEEPWARMGGIRLRTHKNSFAFKRFLIQGSRREPSDGHARFLADGRAVRAA